MPQLINYQGKLLEDGAPANGFRSMTFSLWETDAGGDPASAIWWETQASVEVVEGIYDVQMGSVTALPTYLSDYDALYLQVDIVHPTEGSQRLSPLLELTSTVFAIKAGNAENLDGRDSTYFATVFHNHDSVYVNEGQTSSITSTMIADSAITSADLGADSVSASKIATGAVGSSEILNNSLTSADLGPDSVGSSEIATGAVGTSEIADGFVAATDMQDGAALAEILDDDGSGSGLNADFLDGQNSTAFMPAGTDNWVDTMGDTMTGMLYLDVNSGTSASGIYVDADHTGANGYSYGAILYSDSTNGGAYGLYSDTYSTNSYAYGLMASTSVGSGSTSDAYGIYSSTDQYGSGAGTDVFGLYNYAMHHGTSGTSYGIRSLLYGSDQGDTYGIYSKAIKNNTDTGSLYGLYSYVDHLGTSGYVYGVNSIAYSSDSGSTYGGCFSGCSTSGDTGNLYGIYAYSDNDTSGNTFAGYFYKFGGGNYAGYFYGNVHVSGTLSASTKAFVQPHKDDPTKEIVYVSLEGPEHAVFIRGNAALKDGVAVIKMPEHWQQVAAEKGITVNLTPEGAWAPLYVKSKSKSEVVVRVASGGPEDVSFSYYIMAQREGFQEHEPIQENTHFTAEGISAWEFENRYTEDTPANMAIRGMLRSNGILNAEGKLNAGTADTLDWKITPNEEDKMKGVFPKSGQNVFY